MKREVSMLRRTLLPCLLALCSALAVPAWALPTVTDVPVAGQAARRRPQPVRAGDLAVRRLLRPVERQDMLGRVAPVARQLDGALVAVVSTGSVFGLGARRVAGPLDVKALLGEHLALMDITPDALRALPGFDPVRAPALAPDQVVRVGLVRPFH